jgi:hypothetical protein
VDSHSLEMVLKSCPKLEILSIHVSETAGADYDDVHWTIDLDHIGQALLDHGTNLIDLSLDFSNFKMTRKTTGRIGSLCSISGLRHLKCFRNDLIVAQGWLVDETQEQSILPLESVLPPSITILRIFYEKHRNPSSPPGNVVSTEINNILSSGRLGSLRRIQSQRYHCSPDELILFQTQRPGWSFDSKRTLCEGQNGFIEYMSINKLGL